MKKSVRNYIWGRFKKVNGDENGPDEPVDPLVHWPDLKLCIEIYYNSHPEMKQYQHATEQPVKFEYTEGFVKSLNKHCTTNSLKLKVIDALTKMIYRIPCSGLRDAPIKERNGLWHFYISNSLRVFYRKGDNYMLLEEFCAHKKITHERR